MTETESDFISDTDSSENVSEEELLESEKTVIREDLFNKNTESFRCLTQVEVSRSSLLQEPFYCFPEIDDPGLENILWENAEPPQYDTIGVQRYKDLCKEIGVIPYRRVINSLDSDYLNLKFYGLGEKAIKVICETVQHNTYISKISFQENTLTPESIIHIATLLEKTKTLTSLDLKRCYIGKFGVIALQDCLWNNKTLQELDLSYNNLNDDGMELLANTIKNNHSIKTLNLSHNEMGERASKALKIVLIDNYMIHDLDLSWNNLFPPKAMQELMEGLIDNVSVTSLNLSWNGIGEELTFKPILAFLKSEDNKLRHLDLSNNRITGVLVRMLLAGLVKNNSLITLNLAYNPLTADEVEFISRIFLIFRKPRELKYINFGHIWVNKSYIPMLKRIHKKGCDVTIGGINSNYAIYGPNVKEVVLNRAKFVAKKQKRKKLRKDIGQFIIKFQNVHKTKEQFLSLLKKKKIKLDKSLKITMVKTFTDATETVDLQDMKDVYMNMYPDTKMPEKKKKKRKKKKKKKK